MTEQPRDGFISGLHAAQVFGGDPASKNTIGAVVKMVKVWIHIELSHKVIIQSDHIEWIQHRVMVCLIGFLWFKSIFDVCVIQFVTVCVIQVVTVCVIQIVTVCVIQILLEERGFSLRRSVLC